MTLNFHLVLPLSAQWKNYSTTCEGIGYLSVYTFFVVSGGVLSGEVDIHIV